MEEMEEKILMPNCIGTKFVESEKGNQICILFGKRKNDELDILSNVALSEDGFKTALKHLINFTDTIEEKTGRNILNEILEEYTEEGDDKNVE